MSNRVPYTYYLEWKDGMKYYGVRYGKMANPKDLFVTYFTSSKHVTNYIEQYGNPDIIRIDNTFSTPSEAQEYEYAYLNEHSVSEETRAKISKSLKGRTYSKRTTK